MKKPEALLSKTAEDFNILFEKMTQGAVFHDSEGRIISANPAAMKILGLTEEQIYNRTSLDTEWKTIHEDGSDFPGKTHPAIIALKEKRKVSNVIMGVTNLAENSIRWINVTAEPLFHEGEKYPFQVLVTFDDITDRKKYSDELSKKNLELERINRQMEEEISIRGAQKLKRNERLLRLFIVHAPAAIAMLDKEMRYIIASRRYLADYNLHEQDLTGRNHYEIFPEIPDNWKEIHRRCLAGATEHCEADPFLRTDGRTDWVRWEILPWYEDNDEIGGIIILSEVITDRVLAMEELKLAKERAEELENSFRQLAEAMPQIVWVTDKDGKTIYLNQRWSEYSGWNKEENQERQTADLIHPDDIENMTAKWASCLKEKTPLEATARIRRYDGAYRWFLIRAVPQIDDSGNVVQWLGTSTDIHQQKILEQQLESSNKELEQFAYVVSHDLQEPLRMVTSYMKLLSHRYKGRLDEKADQYISFADDGARRMQTLIKDLLMFSRLTTKAKPHEPTDCRSVIEDVLADLKILILENDSEVTYGDMPIINADPTQIRQLFQNLIENALKFHHHSRRPVVRISAERKEGRWLFSIQDNGIGIEAKYFDRIFITFQRLHEREKYSGNGIGLAACKKIVERHNGRIWVESQPGEGSTFFFTLP